MEIFKGATRHQTNIDKREVPAGLSLERFSKEKLPSAEDVILSKEEEEKLREKLEGLNFSQRQSQVLQFLVESDLTQQQIAESLGVSQSAICFCIAQIRRKVLTALRHGKF